MLFSIIIPTFNYGHLLPRALDSVFEQEGEDYEAIIVDDGSTDHTREVTEVYRAQHGDKVRYLLQDNQGPSTARNTGALHARGDYLLFLDADDRLLPQALDRFRVLCAQSGGIDFAFGGRLAVRDHGVVKRYAPPPLSDNPQENFTHYLRKRLGTIIPGSAIVRRAAFAHMSFPEGVRHNEDIVLFAQLLATCRCVSFPELVVAVYKHADTERRKSERILRADTRVVDALFDPAIVPKCLMSLRDEFLSRHYLMQFRAFYQLGDYRKAKELYRQAIHCFPKHLLGFSYLRRYLRIAFKS